MLNPDRSLSGQLRALPRRLNIFFIMGALVQCLGSLATHWLLMLSLCPEAGQSTNIITSVVNLVLGVWFYLAGLISFFYFFPQSGIRSLGALVIHLANFALHMTHMATTNFTYLPAKYSSDEQDWWAPRVIVLAISVATAVLCFVLLAVNVSRMKLSRNALDLIVIRFKKELQSTLQRVDDANNRELRQRREKERLWKMVETINQCRPLHRDYALATALADYEAAPAPPQSNPSNNNNNNNNNNNGSGGIAGAAATMAQLTAHHSSPNPPTRDGLISPSGGPINNSALLHLATGRTNSFGAPVSPSYIPHAMMTPSRASMGSPTNNNGGSGHAARSLSNALENKFDDWELRPPRYRASSAMSIYQQLCSNIQLNGPIHDAVAREVRLEQIIRHPVTLELLKDAMHREGAAEYIMLLLDIRRYKACPDGNLRGILSREIFDAFLAKGAKYEVMLVDHNLRSPLERMFTLRPGALASVPEEDAPTPLDLFSLIEEDLMRIIQTHHMPKFSCSPAFNVCALLLGRPQMRLRTAARHPTPPASPRAAASPIEAIPQSAAAATAAAMALERAERGPSAYHLAATSGGLATTPPNNGGAAAGGALVDTYHPPHHQRRPSISDSDSQPATAGFGSSVPVATHATTALMNSSAMVGTGLSSHASPGGIIGGANSRGHSASSSAAAAAVAAAMMGAPRGPQPMPSPISPTPLYPDPLVSTGGVNNNMGALPVANVMRTSMGVGTSPPVTGGRLPPLVPSGGVGTGDIGLGSGMPMVTRPPSDEESTIEPSHTASSDVDHTPTGPPVVSPPFAVRNLRGATTGGGAGVGLRPPTHGQGQGHDGSSDHDSDGQGAQSLLIMGSVTSGAKGGMDDHDPYDDDDASASDRLPHPMMMAPSSTSEPALATMAAAATSSASNPLVGGSGVVQITPTPTPATTTTGNHGNTGLPVASSRVQAAAVASSRHNETARLSLTGDDGHLPLLMSPSAALGEGSKIGAPSVNRHPGASAIYDMGPDL
jgi:hypothetical protein